MRIAIIIGTRPEAIKLIPLYLELKSRGSDVELVLTGQHVEMVRQITGFFNVKADAQLSVMKTGQQLAELTASLLVSLDGLFRKKNYECVVVQGDTTTAMTAALTAFYLNVHVAHVEAGLRTFNIRSPFPEEVNRQFITRIAHWNFAPTEKAAQQLESEKASNITVVGNTVIDSLLLCDKMLNEQEEKYRSLFPFINKERKLVLITGHRRENFQEGADGILEAIKELSIRYSNLLFYYPVHLSPQVQEPVKKALSNKDNILLGQPLPYDELIFVMKHAYLILTDSGGIQEEAPTFGVPLLVLRNTTERPEGIERGCAVLAGTEKENIIAAFERIHKSSQLYEQMSAAGNPYGDGTTSVQIANILLGK
jgi:UDP-N-acetylglucosamine 2-epimerase (non-hydrolysing)